MNVSVPEAKLQALASGALERLGLPAEDAALAARVLVLGDLFGISTHGVSRVESYGERIRIGGIKARADVRVERIAPAMAKVDGDNGVGPLVGMRSLHAAMELARESGIGIAFARNSNHFGPVGPYSYLAAEAGFASVIGSNASTTIAPTGGKEARLGNSPVAFAVPNPGGAPFILDMALSVVARAKIRDAAKAGKSIPDTWATDAQGNATTDPKAALEGFLLPIGGHKGYGLALFVDLFAGLLSNAAYLTHVNSWSESPEKPGNLGHFFCLIDVMRLGSESWLEERMQDFRSILHATPPADPQRPVLVPGEIELAHLERQRRDGISLDAAVLERLQTLAR
ncbi:hydroxyacid dehydrogenase [Betaproteobacteria bacterium GR16-43]|nr:hydroxyacid dehydrogenase [Betaproteobacteria bacterium GR16-43]